MKNISIAILIFIYVIKSIAQQIDSSTIYEIKILEKLVVDTTKKDSPLIYFYGLKKEKANMIVKYSRLKIADSIKDADFIFIKNIRKNFSIKKPTLALDFNSLNKCKYCIGVFAWRNGRPMLILIQENLNIYRINLPEEYKYFIETKNRLIGKK